VGGRYLGVKVLAKRFFGYGAVAIKRKSLLAHRAAWELTYGPIPKGMWVLHSCDNPPCVRPDHLHLGGPLENMRERNARGRANWAQGEKSPTAKLTRWEVEEIRRLKGAVPQRDIARMFAVSRSAIAHIHRGSTWTA
jgi:hypothetical protein